MNETPEASDEAKEFVHTYFRKVRYGLFSDEHVGLLSDKAEWAEIKRLFDAEEKARHERYLIHEKKQRIEDHVAKELLEEFIIKKHFPNANWKDKSFLVEEIKEEFNKYDSYDLTYAVDYLTNILKLGLPGVRKRRRRAGKYWSRSIRHGWTVVVNIIAIVVTLAVYQTATDTFQTLAFSLLIYLRVVTFSQGWGQIHTQYLLGIDAEFERLRRLLGDRQQSYEKEQIEEARKRTSRETVDFVINAICGAILYLIVVWKMFSAIL